ncbi:MAG: M20 family metallo-hydrolase [Bacteroidaceae bacterium]|nr:M20 family metallo-hydrolase [Bacteroidaceae bacterium]MBO7171440.1 M20 family metallo-hydrolase [Bacteroidaceae bacterium]
MQNMNIANSSSQAVQLLSQLIETPRISREESQASQLLYDYMTEVCHLDVKRHGCNLWTIAPDFDANKPTLLLNAHIDTVKPVSGWQKDPWKATLEDDCLYGLGSNDDGASLVTLLHAFIELSSKHQPYNLVYLASAEEEVSGKNGIELVIPLLPRIDVAIVGEPTGMHPAIAEKGLMVLDVTAHGKAGHAARNEGDNAIYHAMDDMQWFRTYQWPLSSPLLGPVKMSVTIVNSGTQHNVIPDTCTFTVDVRSNECYTNQELYNAICSQVKSKVKARSFRLGSSRIAPDHPLVTKAVQMGRVPFGSPTLSDQALMPWPSMKMGPGDSSRSHTADEFIRISEIEEAIQLYVEWLDGLRF